MQTITLPEHCTINTASDLLIQLKEAVTEDKVAIDCAAVSQIDTAGLQLLYAYLQEAKTQGIEVNWENTNAVISQAVSTLGLSQKIVF